MSILALLATAKALLLCAYWSKWAELRRQKTLMGNDRELACSMPLIDRHLNRATRSATKMQVHAATQLAQLCRHVVHTRAFDYLLLQLIQSGVRKHRSKAHITKPEVVL
jgi:hypothetical protein